MPAPFDKTKKFRESSYQSEFNMGALDFERFHHIKQALDEEAFFVGQYNYESLAHLNPYLAALRVLFNNIQSILNSADREEFLELFKEAEMAVTFSVSKSKSKIYLAGHKKLIRLHGYLLRTMQKKGLGIQATKIETAVDKTRQLLGQK